MKTRIAIICLLFSLSPLAALQQIVTDHYYIYFNEDHEYSARRVAEVAEEVFLPLANRFNLFEDYQKVHIFVNNSIDQANGYAIYYTNFIEVWTTNMDFPLRGNHDWIRNVVVHELTHIFSLKAAARNWYVFNAFGLNINLPTRNPSVNLEIPYYHLIAPTWFVEGIAQFEDDDLGYESFDTHREMLLRMAALEDKLLSYDEMGVLSDKDKFYGEMVYNQGYNILHYIRKRYGQGKVEALTRNPGLLNFDHTIRKVLDISPAGLYRDWKNSISDAYTRMRVSRGTVVEGKKVNPRSFYNYFPRYSPDGKSFGYLSSLDFDYGATKLVVHDLVNRKIRKYKEFIFDRFCWVPGKYQILYTKPQEGSSLNDLYLYDLEKEKLRAISYQLRAKDPDISADGKRIVFIRNNDGQNDLGVMNIDGTGIKYLTNNQDGVQIYSPRWSPDGKTILFGIYQQGVDRDIAVIRADAPEFDKEKAGDSLALFPDTVAFPDTAGFKLLVATPADERDAVWLPDGKGIVFASDRDSIFNLYKYTLGDSVIRQLTNVVGGAFVPDIAPDGRNLSYAGYHAMDFSIYTHPVDKVIKKVPFKNQARDYQSLPETKKLADLYKVKPYTPKLQLTGLYPRLSFGPTYYQEQFGLDQVQLDLYARVGDVMGSRQYSLDVSLGRNLREKADLNYRVDVSYSRKWKALETENRTLVPSLNARAMHWVINDVSEFEENDYLYGYEFIIGDSVYNYYYDELNRMYHYEQVSKEKISALELGTGLALKKYYHGGLRYSFDNFHINLREKATIYDRYTSYIVDKAGQVTRLGLPQDTSFVGYQGVSIWDFNYFSSHRLSVNLSYNNLKQLKNVLPYLPTEGRYLGVNYQLINSRVVDEYRENDGLEIEPDTITGEVVYYGDVFKPVYKDFNVSELVVQYAEFIGLPFNKKFVLQWMLLGAFHSKPIPTSNFYWPLRYTLGGNYLLRGYPYFTQKGGQLGYANFSLYMPLWQKMGKQALNFYFSKMYLQVFTEFGMVWNTPLTDLDTEDLKVSYIWDIDKEEVKKDIGIQVSLESYLYYRIPFNINFSVTQALERKNKEKFLDPRFHLYFSYE